MTERASHPTLTRLLRSPGAAEALDTVASTLSGADATTLLLEAAAVRARTLSPPEVLARYSRDRFVAPADVDPVALARLRLLALDRLSAGFSPVEVAPVAPLGTHSVLAPVSQHKVVTTMRLSEVAADTTNQLALEAAVRRRALLGRDPRDRTTVTLCGIQRVTRAQVFSGAAHSAHFTLAGVVAAGRDRVAGRFEATALAEVAVALAGVAAEATGRSVEVALTDFSGSDQRLLDAVSERLDGEDVSCRVQPERSPTAYYPSVCFKVFADLDGEVVEVGDGGAVDWTASLLQSRVERLVIGGLGLERLLPRPGGGR